MLHWFWHYHCVPVGLKPLQVFYTAVKPENVYVYVYVHVYMHVYMPTRLQEELEQ